MAVKRSYGFLNKAWSPGDVTEDTEKVPPQNNLAGIMFVPYAEGLTLDEAKISIGTMARPAPKEPVG